MCAARVLSTTDAHIREVADLLGFSFGVTRCIFTTL
jgi:hypothetical protein